MEGSPIAGNCSQGSPIVNKDSRVIVGDLLGGEVGELMALGAVQRLGRLGVDAILVEQRKRQELYICLTKSAPDDRILLRGVLAP